MSALNRQCRSHLYVWPEFDCEKWANGIGGPQNCRVSKTEQIPNCTSRTRLRPSSTSWEARKPTDFDRVLASLAAGVIEEDQPYLVLTEIDRRDAGTKEVEAFCSQLAFAELRSCLENEMGDELRQIANELSANQDLIQVALSSGLRGGTKLVNVLQADGDRNYIRWRHELVSEYLAVVSSRLGVEIEVIEQPVVV
jgi:hypothetical protein